MIRIGHPPCRPRRRTWFDWLAKGLWVFIGAFVIVLHLRGAL